MARLNMKQLHKILVKCKSIKAAKRFLCGEHLGSGVHRDVYVLKQNPNFVVKIERDMAGGTFANVTEWRNYINNREWTWFEQWLAPCELITEQGHILIQQRVFTTGKLKKDYPTHVPTLFTDLKYANFGWIGDRVVCCDYAFLMYVSIYKNKMKRARWWANKPPHEKKVNYTHK